MRRVLKWRGITPDVFKSWVKILSTPGRLPEALETLGLLESAGEARRTDVPCPDWLLLALPALVRSREEAPYLCGILLGTRFAKLDGQDQGIFVARCVQALLRARNWVAAEECVDWFCEQWGLLPRERSKRWKRNMWGSSTQGRAFGRVLAALTLHRLRPGSHGAPPAHLLRKLSRRLQEAYKDRELAPCLSFFLPLFSSSLIPTDPKHATRLMLEMHQAGFTPPDEVLHSLMSVYGAAGDAPNAEKIWLQLEGRRALRQGFEGVEEGEGEGQVHKGPFDFKWATTRLRAIARSSEPKEGGGDKLSQAKAFFEEVLLRAEGKLDSIGWNEFLRLVAMEKYIPAPALLELFDRLDSTPTGEMRTTPRPNQRTYTILLQGLLRRNEHELAVEMWEKMLDGGLKPDAVILGLAARATAAAKAPADAEELLRAWAHRPGDPHKNLLRLSKGGRKSHRLRGRLASPRAAPPPSATAEAKRSWALTGGHPHSIKLDVVTLNSLLLAYSRSGQFRKVYQLWLSLLPEWGVEADMASLSIVLDSARIASARAGSGYGPGFEAVDRPGGGGLRESDLWEGREAWRVAERIMWDVLERNWPRAALELEDPLDGAVAKIKRPQSSGGGILTWFQTQDRAPRQKAFTATLSPDPPLYPHLTPSLTTFRSFIQLLGFHSNPHSIPVVLSWMKKLQVEPDRKLLTQALMYVGEVGLREKEERGLRGWLEEWVGEEGVPDEAEVAFWRSGGKRMARK